MPVVQSSIIRMNLETSGFGVLKIDLYLLRGMVLPFAATLGVLVALFGGFSLSGILADAVGGLLPVWRDRSTGRT